MGTTSGTTPPTHDDLADELAKMTARWRKTRRALEALHTKHEYLLAAWAGACADNDRLRAQLQQLEQNQHATTRSHRK